MFSDNKQHFVDDEVVCTVSKRTIRMSVSDVQMPKAIRQAFENVSDPSRDFRISCLWFSPVHVLVLLSSFHFTDSFCRPYVYPLQPHVCFNVPRAEADMAATMALNTSSVVVDSLTACPRVCTRVLNGCLAVKVRGFTL